MPDDCHAACWTAHHVLTQRLRTGEATLGLPLACLPVTGSYWPTPCILSDALSAGRYPRPFSVMMWISTGPAVWVDFTSAPAQALSGQLGEE